MPSLLKNLSPAQQSELFDFLNYLNIEEYTSFCRIHGIPFSIYIELPSGKRKKTSDKDRKAIVLQRIRKFLQTGKMSTPTTIQKDIVRLEKKTGSFRESDFLYYGQYDKKNPKLIKLLKHLTGGRFKDGAVAREVLRDFWTKGRAPTLKQFANAWIKAQEKQKQSHPEWAFLNDRAKGLAEKDWKALRLKKAKIALKMLESVSLPSRQP